MEVALIIWLLCGIGAAMIGARKGEGCAGFVLGILLGPFGILFALLSKGNRVPCPHCRELMHKDATICPHCREHRNPDPGSDAPMSPKSPPPSRPKTSKEQLEERRKKQRQERAAGWTFLGLGVVIALGAVWTLPVDRSAIGNLVVMILGAGLAVFGLFILSRR
jgi:hypothetical protein